MNAPRKIGLGMLSLDPSRIGEALSRPGMDTRTWASLAIVTEVHVSKDGVYVDVTTITGLAETASVPAVYGGAGFGLYCPVAVDDWVLIVVPEGDWNAGARVVAQIWDPGTPPPQEAIDHPRDPAWVVEPGRTFRLVTEEGGEIVLEVGGAGVVRVGAESAHESALLGDAFLSALDTLINAIASAMAAITTGAPAGGGPAGTAITAANEAFKAVAALYKSQLVKLS